MVDPALGMKGDKEDLEFVIFGVALIVFALVLCAVEVLRS
jgi:hypothetical protein